MLATTAISRIRRHYYNLVSKSIAYQKARWLFTLCLTAIYIERSYGMSYSVITYLIGFYILQLVVSYFTPKGLQIQDSQGLLMEESQIFIQEFTVDAEAKPLVASMSQFTIWERVSFAISLGIFCTCFKLIEIDVFWPLLVVYFIVLVCYTVHKIVTKMEKYRYGFGDFIKKAPVL